MARNLGTINASGTLEGVAVAEQRIIGRKTGGDLGPLTAAEVSAILASAGQLGITIDGGGAAITTGVKGFLRIPYDCTINSVEIVADQTGSCVVDLWVDTYANFPPTDADTITASAVPTLSAAQKSQDATLTGWTTSLTEGSYLAFNVDSAATVTRVTVIIEVTKA